MAYSAGDPILDDEYNIFVASTSDPFGYNHFAGTGATTFGLNQASIATVSAGDAIAASNWNALFTGIDNIANHLNRSVTSSSVSAGDTIAIRSALVADLANLAADVVAGGVNVTAVADRAAGTSTNGATYNVSSTIERSITFANNATMRAFFNAGGSIKIDPGISGSTDGDKDTVFNDLANAVGVLEIKAHATTRSGSGETETSFDNGNGFHDLDGSYDSKIKLTSDNSGYTSNTMEIFAKLDAAVGSAVVITIKMVCTDPNNDDTFTSGNPTTPGGAANPNECPAMVLALTASEPTAAQGLAAAIQFASNAEVSNSVAN
jgi:hypothetical protein|tara:strand:+ start:1594 stop:2553 length:960 start_codon:yes stop_codon:yes gene_type:complete